MPPQPTRDSHRAARACAQCRASKVKCKPVSDDEDLCQRCERLGDRCTFLPTRKERSLMRKRGGGLHYSSDTKEHLESPGDPRVRAGRSPRIVGAGRSSEVPSVGSIKTSHMDPSTDITGQLRALYTDDILNKAIDIFFHHFYTDIFFSLHEPSVRSSAQSGTLKPLLATAILALTARFIPELVEEHGGGCAAGDYFADAIRHHLVMTIDKPSLEKLQGLIFLSLHEWGSRRGGTAFIYIGLAIRGGLLLRAFRKQTPLAPPFNKPVETHEEFIVEETRVRVWGSMNSMDCLLASGTNRPSLPTYNETSEIDMPCSEDAFIWGNMTDLKPRQALARDRSDKACLISAVRNWGAVNRWVSSGGISKTWHPPWSAESTFFAMQRLLSSWEEELPPKLRFDRSFFAVHAVNRRAGSYGFMHLLHSSSVIFLHRQNLRFFPIKGGGRPVCGLWRRQPGQAEDDDDDEQFWDASLRDLFSAAIRTTDVLCELEANDSLMITPFMGFAAFTAATVNMYLAIFGWVFPELSAGARERTESNVRFLKKAVSLWPLAQQWYDTMIRLFDLYRQFHQRSLGADDGATILSSEAEAAFQSFDKTLIDYGEICPRPDDMAAIVAAKDNDGYKHGVVLKRQPEHEDHQMVEGGLDLEGLTQSDLDGSWGVGADEFLIMDFDLASSL